MFIDLFVTMNLRANENIIRKDILLKPSVPPESSNKQVMQIAFRILVILFCTVYYYYQGGYDINLS